MKSRKHMTPTQRLYVLTVDTGDKMCRAADLLGATAPRTDRLMYWHDRLHAELLRRLAAYDEAIDARVAERFMSQAMESAVTDYGFFTAVVNRINLDAAEIARLKAELNPWRVMFPVNTPAEIAAKLMRGG